MLRCAEASLDRAHLLLVPVRRVTALQSWEEVAVRGVGEEPLWSDEELR